MITNDNNNNKYRQIYVYKRAFEILIKVFNDENIEFVGNFIFSDTDIVLVFRFISKNFNNINTIDSIKSLLFLRNYEPPSLYYSNIDSNSNSNSNSILITSEPVNSNYKLIEKNKFFIYKNIIN